MDKQISRVTLKDVADNAGVSTATVSHVINNTRFVSPELTSKVKRSIEELHYYPNHMIGSIRSNRTYTVGLVIPSIANETFGYLAEIIQRILFKNGYNLIIVSNFYDKDIENEALNMLIMKNVDAVILTPTTRKAEKIRELIDRGIKVLLIDRTIPGIEVDKIRVDNKAGGYIGTQFLLSLGHKEIGYIDRKIEQSHSLDQKAGYLQALKEHGIDNYGSNVIKATGFDYKAGEQAARELLTKNPKITAIFTYYDVIALGAMRGILSLGKEIPKDISVLGYDNMPLTEAICPPLSTVSIPIDDIATMACQRILEKMENSEISSDQTKDIILQPSLVIRKSTARMVTNS